MHLEFCQIMGPTAEGAGYAEKIPNHRGHRVTRGGSPVTNKLCALSVSWGSAVCSAPAAAARRFDSHSFPGTQANASLAGDFLFRTVAPDDQVAARSAVRSSGQAIRSPRRAVGEQSDLASVKTSISRTIPSPPVWRPAPPLWERKEYCRRRTGYAYSRASAGVFRALVMWGWTRGTPSFVGRAPMPPAMVS